MKAAEGTSANAAEHWKRSHLHETDMDMTWKGLFTGSGSLACYQKCDYAEHRGGVHEEEETTGVWLHDGQGAERGSVC